MVELVRIAVAAHELVEIADLDPQKLGRLKADAEEGTILIETRLARIIRFVEVKEYLV